MSSKVIDLKERQQEKRQEKGWTMEEIKENASRELKEFKELSESEPEDLVSGDMQKIIKDEDEDDEKDRPTDDSA